MLRQSIAHRLPQLSDQIFLTDGGLETTLIFHEGIDLPLFASFDLLKQREGMAQIRDYYRALLPSSRAMRVSASCWKARPGAPIRTGRRSSAIRATALADVNRKAIELMLEMRDEFETPRSPMVISGNIGPRGDGYQPGQLMSANEARGLSRRADRRVRRDRRRSGQRASRMNYADEAIGIARAAKAAGMPVVISFTVETDGRLPTGQTLKEAIAEDRR